MAEHIYKPVICVMSNYKALLKWAGTPGKVLHFPKTINFHQLLETTYLEKFVQLEQTQNEKSQNLEQLRLMDNNIEIDVGLAKTKPIGVDTDEDYLEIKKIMEYKN